MGLTVSCDMNYRKNLWKWGKKASEVMPELFRWCDVAIGNEEDAKDVFGIEAPEADITAGKVAAEFVPLCLRKAGRALPQPEDSRDHPARFDFGLAQYLVRRALAPGSVLRHPHL